MEKSFQTEKFPVTIVINNDYIEFFKTNQIRSHKEWLKELSEYELDELDEEQKQTSNFYWLGVDDWISDYRTTRQGEDRTDNWHRHIKRKNWFTDEMYEWLNKMLIPEVEGLVNSNLRKQRLINLHNKV